jgi:hypothetical protein
MQTRGTKDFSAESERGSEVSSSLKRLKGPTQVRTLQ